MSVLRTDVRVEDTVLLPAMDTILAFSNGPTAIGSATDFNNGQSNFELMGL